MAGKMKNEMSRRSMGLLWALMMALMLFGAACSDEGGDTGTQTPVQNPDSEPTDDGCTEGFLGCDCIDGIACFPGSNWVCLEGECREPVCEPGSTGCACYANNTCDPDADNNPQLCNEGICEQMLCDPGSMGCVCAEGGLCEDGLTCDVVGGELQCAPADCEAGSEGCVCGDARACDGGLICAQETCVQANCRVGTEDCFCQQDLSCNDGLQCNGEDTRCEPIPCTPGSTGCTCDEGDCTAPNALCGQDGLCAEVDCPNGTEGCACMNDRCVVDGQGEQLFCEDGLCRNSDCAPGAVGCSCQNGVRCETGAECIEGACVVADCEPGSENCACTGGLCQSGLRCRQDNVCVDGTGFVNNACREDGSCERGARCTDSDICRRCTLGVPGCACDDADNCLTGAVCIAGMCLAEADVPPQPPETPFCRSFCDAEGVTINGEFVACDSDNLVDGCVNGRECIEGQCLFPDEDPITCQSENDCSHWQTCINGLCLSECKESAECTPGKQCYNNTCRIPCDSNTESTCGEGFHCLTTDGEAGFCHPNQPTEGEPSLRVLGGFSMNTTRLEFSNTQVTQRFAIFNNSPAYQTFTIRKKSHLLQFAEGDSQRAVRAADGPIECNPDEQDDCSCDEDNPNECLCDGPNCFCSGNDDCVGNGFSCNLGVCRPTGCTEDTCPMFWLGLGEGREAEDTSPIEEFEVGIEAGGSAELVMAGAADMNGVRWQGAIDVVSPELGTQRLDLLYNEVPEGQWAGTMVYLASFGTQDLEKWRFNQETRNGGFFPGQNGNEAVVLNNALVTRWQTFREGDISWDEMQAVLRAVETGSWKYTNVRENCPTEIGACYMYDINRDGLQILSNDLEAQPVPTGVVELPIAMNLRIPDSDGAPGTMVGRIESSKALHYAGNPSVNLGFIGSPEECSNNGPIGTCVSFMDNFNADIMIGGRYVTSPGDTNCAAERPGAGFFQQREPWLIPGFLKDTTRDDETGRRYRYECRDSILPFVGQDQEEQDSLAPFNRRLTISNPIPDARTRRRTLTFVDGALINQSQLIIFFEEKFESFLGGDDEGFSSFGYMVLKRRATDLDDTDERGEEGVADVFEGAVPTDDREEPEDVLAPTCSEDLLEEILDGATSITRNNVTDAITTLIDGVPSSADPILLTPNSAEQVHYFCEDTGLFDGGPENTTKSGTNNSITNNNSCDLARNGVCEDGGSLSIDNDCDLGTDAEDCPTRFDADEDLREACPAGSRVEFFTLDSGEISQADIAALDCQLNNSCIDTLNLWKDNGTVIVQEKPSFRCSDDNAIFCDTNRLDLRDGKDFYSAAGDDAVLTQLPTLVDEAFRYKTRFQNRQGQGIGFTPEVCIPDSDQTPYCYDPAQIEAIEDRVDCLLHIHQNFYDDLNQNETTRRARNKLDDFLEFSFSFTEENNDFLPLPITHDGFERRNAELLIMLGDESFTRAFASRFDLAESNNASFEGSLFEDDGIDLSGAVGFEMFSLYQGAQYFQKVLDRFFVMSPVFWEATSFGPDNPRNFVTAETVLRYFDRVIRASTQKARTWSEVSKRYQSLGRPDLARSVVERAYTATYLESVIISRMMNRILDEATLSENEAQIKVSIDDAQLRYRAAMVDMQSVHSEIQDNLTIFGFEPDFIPFPALDAADFRQSNAFEVLLNRARNKVQFAAQREEVAINSNREFETNQAQFQSELTQVRNNFEGQLADICGTFESNDRIFPAIRKYAHLSDLTTFFGNPCGLMGNGQLNNAMAALEDHALDAQSLQIQFENVLEEVDIERDRVAAQCDIILENADFLYGACPEGNNDEAEDFFRDPFLPIDRGGCIQAQILDLQRDIRISNFAVSKLQMLHQSASTYANLTKCFAGPIGTDCTQAGIAAVGFTAATAAIETGVALTEGTIIQREEQIGKLERFRMKWQTERECDSATVESEARVRTMLLRLRELELETLRLEHRTRLAFGEVDRIRNLAKRLEAQQVEAEQLAINVQAAHNNPNVRIYKNDAIINAEIAFDSAIREVYKLTKVFEYYTSQSYAQRNDLFLIRLVSRGDVNLENYLNEIENTFFEFEEFFGHPSNRVHIVSLKNDILSVPYNDLEGQPLSDSDRTSAMRERLSDKRLLDRNGYITLPFSTNLDQVSPLTRNHKILHVEADIYGNDTGDLIGRVYMRQRGTSVIKGVEGDKQFHRFDERTGVINAIFGGVRFFENTIYQNFRHRDRPFVNTHWELVINQRDELVNQDINLNALTDIRLYIYYTDLTVF